MSVQVENLEKSMAKLTIEVSAEKLEEALQEAYNRQKNRISLPGFRKGKVPRNMVEKMYGPEIFYEDAANLLIQKEYGAAVKESGEDVVSQPEIDIVQLEKGKPFIFTAAVAVKPEVTLGKYMGVTVTKIDTTVTDEEVDAEVERQRENNARSITIEDRPVADGDTTVIDFEGFVDGEAFEGGKGENYPLVIGSHSFIDTFEDQLIGKNVGDECEVNVTFPTEYHADNLAGKPAVFNVKINEIKFKELPELNDEFAEEVSEFDTLEAYKEDVKKKLAETKEKQAATENENRVVEKVVEASSMDIPEAMIDTQVNNMINDYARRMQSQGISLDDYMKYTGMTVDNLKEQMKPQAVKRIQTRLVLEAIAKAENIQVSDEAVEGEIAGMAAAYKMEADQLKEYMGEAEIAHMKEDMAVQSAVDFLVAEAKLV